MEYAKITEKGMDIKLRKKFQGIELRDFFELTIKEAE